RQVVVVGDGDGDGVVVLGRAVARAGAVIRVAVPTGESAGPGERERVYVAISPVDAHRMGGERAGVDEVASELDDAGFVDGAGAQRDGGDRRRDVADELHLHEADRARASGQGAR